MYIWLDLYRNVYIFPFIFLIQGLDYEVIEIQVINAIDNPVEKEITRTYINEEV